MHTVMVRPEGSIETLKQIDEIVYDAFKNKTKSDLYFVGQLGDIFHYVIDEHSSLTNMEGLGDRLISHVNCVWKTEERDFVTSFCPGDCNADGHNYYNDHYLFADKAKAEKFSEFLKNDPAHCEAVKKHHEHCEKLFGDNWDQIVDDECWEHDCREMNEVEGQEIRMQDNWA